MINRIRILDTEDPQKKIFAFTKRLESSPPGFVRCNGTDLSFFYANNTMASELPKLDEVVHNIARIRAVDQVSVESHSRLAVTIGPAFFWHDRDEDVEVLQHVIRVILDGHFRGVDAELVVETSECCIHVFAANEDTRMFVVSAPLSLHTAETYRWRGGNGAVAGTASDPRASEVADALLANPHIISVRISGKQAAVQGGYWNKEQKQIRLPVEGELLDYVVATLRNIAYGGRYVPVVQKHDRAP